MSKHRADAPVNIEELEGVFYHVACIVGCECKHKAEDQHVVFVTSYFEGFQSLAKARVVREIVNNYSNTYGRKLDFDSAFIDLLLSMDDTTLYRTFEYSRTLKNRVLFK